jgi:hypothetical protein
VLRSVIDFRRLFKKGPPRRNFHGSWHIGRSMRVVISLPFLFCASISLLCFAASPVSPPVSRVGRRFGIPLPSVFVSAHLPITSGRLSNEITFPRQRIHIWCPLELSGTDRHWCNWLAFKSAAGGLAGGGDGGVARYKVYCRNKKKILRDTMLQFKRAVVPTTLKVFFY